VSDIVRQHSEETPILAARKCHCGDWAGFGFGKNKKNDEWWCWKHYPYKTSARLEAAELAEMLADKVA
jgi:hypothetical protein